MSHSDTRIINIVVSQPDMIIQKLADCFFFFIILLTALKSRCNLVVNGRCSHFCFPTPSSSRVCGCPYGMKLQANQRECIKDESVPPPDICSQFSFECDEGRCRPNSYRCDGISDCIDETDEANCTDTGKCVIYKMCSGRRSGRKVLIHLSASWVFTRSNLLSTSVHLQQQTLHQVQLALWRRGRLRRRIGWIELSHSTPYHLRRQLLYLC